MRFGGISNLPVNLRSRSGGAGVAVQDGLTEPPPQSNLCVVNSNAALRQIRAFEWALVREIRLRALADSPDAFGRCLADELSMPDQAWIERAERGALGLDTATFIAETDAVWVGLATVRLAQDADAHADLFGLWVDPSARAAGVGLALMQTVIDWARRHGARMLALLVVASNAAAIHLYRRVGFEETGKSMPMPRDPSLIEIEMELDLTRWADAPG
jgi:ribosomal protein S18 acetylase RimI-like enzyme